MNLAKGKDNINRIILSQDFLGIEELLSKQQFYLIIGDLDEYPLYCEKAEFLRLDYNEFYSAIEKNTFLLKNKIIFECPEEEYKILKLIKTISALKLKYGINFCLLIKENYFLNSKNKYLYEILEASYVEDYVIKKELSDNV